MNNKDRRRLYASESKLGYHGKVIYPRLVNSNGNLGHSIVYLDEDSLSWKFGAHTIGLDPYGSGSGFSHITTDLDKNMYITYTNLSTSGEIYLTVQHTDLSSNDVFKIGSDLQFTPIITRLVANRNYGWYSINNVVTAVNLGYLWIHYDKSIGDNKEGHLIVINLSDTSDVIDCTFPVGTYISNYPFQLYSTSEGLYGLGLGMSYPNYHIDAYKIYIENSLITYSSYASYCNYDTSARHYCPIMVGNKAYIAVNSMDYEGYIYELSNALTSTQYYYDRLYRTYGSSSSSGSDLLTCSILMNNPQYTDLSKPTELSFLFGSYIGNTDYPIYRYGSSGKLSMVTVTDPTGTNPSYRNMSLGCAGMIRVREDLWVGRYGMQYSNPYAFITRDKGQTIQLVDNVSFLNGGVINQTSMSHLPNIIVV